MQELIFIKGKGWVYKTVRSAEDIINAYTEEIARQRDGKRCGTCSKFYLNHSGDSCDYPYKGREWSDA